MCACVRACARARARECVRACIYAATNTTTSDASTIHFCSCREAVVPSFSLACQDVVGDRWCCGRLSSNSRRCRCTDETPPQSHVSNSYMQEVGKHLRNPRDLD